jgi:hypothetical protein
MELGFPLILLLGPRGRMFFLVGVAPFYIGNLVLLHVGFVLIPIVFVFFFDLEPAWQKLRARFGKGGAPS